MADTSVKLSGTYDSIEAYNILEEMRDMSSDYEEIRTEAAAAASAATAASAAATNAVNTANEAVSSAQTYAGNANSSASEAAGYASNASTSATNAAASATNASNSASAAATSETNAAASETNAANSATAAADAVASVTQIVTGTMTALNGSLDSTGTALRYMGRWVECSVRMSGISGTAANTWNNLIQLPTKFIPQMEFDFAGVNNTAGTCMQAQITPAGVIRVWGQVATFRCHCVYIRKV